VSSPDAVFARAQDALARGDWEAFFACLDRTELLVIARNSAKALAATPADPASPTAALFAAHGFPLDLLRARGQEIIDSARAMLDDPTPLAARMEQSLRHHELVKRYDETLESGLRGVTDLAAFTAGLERAMRAAAGGGSVSARLFADETLTDLVIEGSKARGRRRRPDGGHEEIAFVKKKRDWYIRLPKRRL
jgi:hypothetical protein